MNLAQKIISRINEKDGSDLFVVRQEVTSSFTQEQMDNYDSFEDFFADVDVQNAYEPEWKPKKWKPFYKAVWKEFKKSGLKFAA